MKIDKDENSGWWEKEREFYPHDLKPKVRGNWEFERSSGYAGWRCKACATWVYNGQPLVCDCNKITH